MPEDFATDSVATGNDNFPQTVSGLNENWKLLLASIIDIYARSATALIYTEFDDDNDRKTVARIKDDAFRLVDIIHTYDMLKDK